MSIALNLIPSNKQLEPKDWFSTGLLSVYVFDGTRIDAKLSLVAFSINNANAANLCLHLNRLTTSHISERRRYRSIEVVILYEIRLDWNRVYHPLSTALSSNTPLRQTFAPFSSDNCLTGYKINISFDSRISDKRIIKW